MQDIGFFAIFNSAFMPENNEFIVEKKIKTEKDIKHQEQRIEVVNKTQDYAKQLAEKQKKEREEKEAKRKQAERLKKDKEKKKKQEQERQKEARKNGLINSMNEYINKVEDFIMIEQNPIFQKDGTKNINPLMKQTNYMGFEDYVDILNNFKKNKKENVEILGEEEYQKIVNKINDIPEIAVNKEKLKGKQNDNISQSSTRPSTAFSSISVGDATNISAPSTIISSKQNKGSGVSV